MRVRLYAAVAALAALGATAAHAQFVDYGSEAGWDIKINEQMGPGCLVTQTTPGGMQIQMGINLTHSAPEGYIALYAQNDPDVSQDEVIAVTFDVDGEKFIGDFKGQEQREGWRGAFVRVNNPDFVYDLAKKQTLTITADDGRDPVVIDLTGTNAAFEALRACQDAQAS